MIIIIRYGEIALKGKNRGLFENKLTENIRAHAQDSELRFLIKRGRFILYSSKMLDLTKVFGISTYSYAQECKAELDEIKTIVKTLVKSFNEDTQFRISARRIDKSSTMDSKFLNVEIGKLVQEQTNAKVSLTDYDKNIGIEILENQAYVFLDTVEGPGGLPVGTQRIIYGRNSDDNGLLASILMLKRGCSVYPMYDHGIEIFKDYMPQTRIISTQEKSPQAVGDVFGKICNYGFPVFRPLIGYTESEILSLKKAYLQ